jgi:murein DD-endopeptidase MepM/ murein hydrolase activator NlpD
MDPVTAVPRAAPAAAPVGRPPASGFADTLARAAKEGVGTPLAPTTASGGAASAAAVQRTTLGGMLRAAAPGITSALAGWSTKAPVQPTTAAAPVTTPDVVGAPDGLAARLAPLGPLHVPVEGRFTSGFGMRVHPVTGERRRHAGVDIAAPTGTPVAAVAGGTVVHAGASGGYGTLVEVDHGNGVTSRYAHLSAADVAVGDRLAPGQRLGAVGSTGRSTGPHLHLELRVEGEPVDAAFLTGHGHDGH